MSRLGVVFICHDAEQDDRRATERCDADGTLERLHGGRLCCAGRSGSGWIENRFSGAAELDHVRC
jgi:hypothetical protein